MRNHRFFPCQIAGACLAVSLLTTTLALAETEFRDGAHYTPDSYGWVDVGASRVPEFGATLQSSISTYHQQGTMSMNPGFAVNGGFGQWLDSWLAIEVQAGFLYNGIDSFQPTGANATSFNLPCALPDARFLSRLLDPK